ncbi:MerR family DNA-binding protein [Amycolatopsis sulphurea]|uniref:MerR family DNA-binding protein n=1 Tax=Amycolatopsis sulphurea TaxID=76022 RepID=UPI001B80DB28|nr:MerR family DNA-binding protein [Amycolatopsis sulphurea]
MHRVLVYRELGFPLAEIGRILDDPGTDERAHLRRQRGEPTGRIARLQHMVSAVDRMLDAIFANADAHGVDPRVPAKLAGDPAAGDAEVCALTSWRAPDRFRVCEGVLHRPPLTSTPILLTPLGRPGDGHRGVTRRSDSAE